jgi:prevent-host-death family protein
MARQRAGRAVTVVQARADFDDIVRRTSAGGEAVVVEDNGVPAVVILSNARYEELLRDARLARFERTTRAAGAVAAKQGLTEEQLEREMEEIKRLRHQQAYG